MDITAVAPPWEGALAWKIPPRRREYEIDEHGPWDGEPDKVQWVDPTTGLDCLIVRNHFGGLCGYVGVPNGHKAYEADYMDLRVEVHGGLTFGDKCQGEGDEPSPGICHVPLPGRPHDVFWLGFDCGHHMDFQPGLASMERKVMPLDLKPPPYGSDFRTHGRYRTLAYVRAECTNLAAQLSTL